MRERAAAFGVAALHWEELANGEHAAISHGAVLPGPKQARKDGCVLLTHNTLDVLRLGDKALWPGCVHPCYCLRVRQVVICLGWLQASRGTLNE